MLCFQFSMFTCLVSSFCPFVHLFLSRLLHVCVTCTLLVFVFVWDNDDVAKQSINALIGYQPGNLFHLRKIHNKSYNCLFKSHKQKKRAQCKLPPQQPLKNLWAKGEKRKHNPYSRRKRISTCKNTYTARDITLRRLIARSN